MQQTDKILYNLFDGLIEYTYICIKHSRIFVDWETHQIKDNSEASSYREWRAATFGFCTAQRITNSVKHSNPVYRSFFIPTKMRLFYLK